MYKTMLLVSLTGLAAGGPIPITGRGTFWFDYSTGGGAGWQVSFSGSAGERNVSLSADCNSPLTWCSIDGSRGWPATIDGTAFSLGSFTFSLGTPGVVQGYQAGKLAITEEIDGVLSETSRMCVAVYACQGTFAIAPGLSPLISSTSVPEPSGFWLCVVGLALFRKIPFTFNRL